MSSFGMLKQMTSDEISHEFEKAGHSPLVGRILALLLFAPEPLSLQVIAESIGVSKAAISVQVRRLEQSKMCRKTTNASDRKDYYYIEDNFSYTLIVDTFNKIKNTHQQLDRLLDQYPLSEEVDEEEKDSYEVSKKRLEELCLIHQLFLERMSGIKEEWEKKRERIPYENE